jgi:hypothetical protein
MLRVGIDQELELGDMNLEAGVRVTELVLADMNLLGVRVTELVLVDMRLGEDMGEREEGVMNLGVMERGRRWLRGGRGLLIDDVPRGEGVIR